MKLPLISEPGSSLRGRQQAGVTMLVVAIAMVAIIAMAALSIDVVTLYLARMETQRSADAAALAAARVISVSGLTGDPLNASASWQAICGVASPPTPATQAAAYAAQQNLIGGVAPTTANVTVKYSAGGNTPNPDCSTMPAAFGVNPMVTVVVKRNNLPTFFSRLWGATGNSVSATAAAEAFNSSNSSKYGNGTTGTTTPVQPRCVKPWLIPNRDPLYPGPGGNGWCDQGGGACQPYVDTATGQIMREGISIIGGYDNVIGETLELVPDCHRHSSTCVLRSNPPLANYAVPLPEQLPSLVYLPGEPPSTTPVAVPSCSAGTNLYQEAIAGCDQSTVYQCGVQNGNVINLAENPGPFTGDTTNGVTCLINQDNTNPNQQPSGQDTIVTTSYPFQIRAGSSNALVSHGSLSSGADITASNSIVSLPIYDSGPSNNETSINPTGLTQVTIVGFLQVFINQVDANGNVSVTVLNVTGCGNGQGKPPVGNPVTGSSPVPIRLITPP